MLSQSQPAYIAASSKPRRAAPPPPPAVSSELPAETAPVPTTLASTGDRAEEAAVMQVLPGVSGSLPPLAAVSEDEDMGAAAEAEGVEEQQEPVPAAVASAAPVSRVPASQQSLVETVDSMISNAQASQARPLGGPPPPPRTFLASAAAALAAATSKPAATTPSPGAIASKVGVGGPLANADKYLPAGFPPGPDGLPLQQWADNYWFMVRVWPPSHDPA